MARSPVWSPDGKHLLFLGNRETNDNDKADWWMTPLDGGPAALTGIHPALEKYGLAPSPDSLFNPAAWAANGQGVLSARLADSTNLWQLRMRPEGPVGGPPQRLTFGTGLEAYPSVAPAGKMVFSTLANNIDLWHLPMNTAQGKATGPIERLTQDPAADIYPSFSSDGKKLIFISTRSGSRDLWLRDEETGRETIIVAQTGLSVISRDGSRVLFAAGTQMRWNALPLISKATSRPSTPQLVCENCSTIWDLSADGKWVLHGRDADTVITARELATGQSTEFLRAGEGIIGRLHISPDDRWVGFHHRKGEVSQIFVVPFRPGALVTRDQWIAVTSGKYPDSFPTWSPDGGMLYYLSNRDGRLCLWGQRVDRSTGRATG